jgi:uncharacterized membrane protein
MAVGTLPTVAPPKHPALEAVAKQRAQDLQLRVADAITTFAGSMTFIYIHAVLFAIWCGSGLFGSDKFPFPLLTMGVSLEAIFLSTFVMIGQNRQAKVAEAKASHDFVEQEGELKTNTELTKMIHDLSKEMHASICGKGSAGR